jgi:hypothetical protein
LSAQAVEDAPGSPWRMAKSSRWKKRMRLAGAVVGHVL